MFSTFVIAVSMIIGATLLFVGFAIGLSKVLETTCIEIELDKSDLE